MESEDDPDCPTLGDEEDPGMEFYAKPVYSPPCALIAAAVLIALLAAILGVLAFFP